MPLGEKTANCTEGIFFIHPQVLDGPGKNVFRYDGSASGRMLYNWNRDYNPALGRYTESDPIGLAGGSMSTYGYVGGGPLSSIDPNGLQAAAMPGMPPLPPVFIPGTQANQQFVDSTSRAAQAIADWVHSVNEQSDAQSQSQAQTVKQFCSKCNATATRASAQAAAYVWAGAGPNSTPTPWSNFNPPGGAGFKKGPVWADFFRNNSAPNFGASGPMGHVEEHPFGHPDLPGGLNHDCPHFVATNAKGVTVEFPYRPD